MNLPFSLRWPLVLFVAALAAGCRDSADTAAPAARPFEGVKLKLAIVEDPALAAAASQFQGTWKTSTGAEFEVQEITLSELAGSSLAADAVIYPAHQLGPLAGRGLLQPVPKQILDDPQFQWLDVFETIRMREATWDGTVYGLPFGSPVLVCLYRADLFDKLKLEPPQTWSDYQRLAETLHDRAQLGEAAPAADAPWCGAIEPLANGWAGLTLLARAAPYAKHPDFFSALFNMDSMEPLVDSPPYVKALEELVAASKQGPTEPLRITPADARAAFWRGECAIALTWPSGAKPGAGHRLKPGLQHATDPPPGEAAFVELPGSKQVYQPEQKKWSDRGEALSQVPLVSIAGRMGSVLKSSANPQAAFELLASLSGPQWSEQVSSASPEATLFRGSHVKSPRAWVDAQANSAAARSYASVASEALSRQDALAALPIPGRERYLAAFDEAVHAAVGGKASAAEALSECARKWREITADLGLVNQQKAYRRSVLSQ